MHEKDFIPKSSDLKLHPENGEIAWDSPSNIALVKYWGKKEGQIPANASISFTLSECKTNTKLVFRPKLAGNDEKPVTFYFEGKQNDAFGEKTFQFFEKVKPYFPFIDNYAFQIHTENTFPHSSGIASSASGMSALALCLTSLEKAHRVEWNLEEFYRKASFAARLGSGSAARSVFGKMAMWGKHKDFEGSSDLYAVASTQPTAEVFESFKDVILLVDQGKKQVSSTVGHGLLKGHPFGQLRFEAAEKNMSRILPILKAGELEDFGKLVEQEALMLHALMMTSDPYFILMKPNTLAIIEAIWEFRREKDVPVYFTLDAGANVHLLFPESAEQTVMQLVKDVLVGFCEDMRYMCDHVGNGPGVLTPEL